MTSTSIPQRDTAPRITARSLSRGVFAALEREAAELARRKNAAVSQFLADIEWMEIPQLRLARLFVDDNPNDGVEETWHAIKEVWADSSRGMINMHIAGRCPADGHWCRRVGETRWPRGRHTIGFTFVGDYQFMTLDGDDAIFIPLGALEKRSAA